MTTTLDTNGVVTLVIQHKVRSDALSGYEDWLQRTVKTASLQPGHLGANSIRPGGGSRLFTTVVRFTEAHLLQAWIDSSERAALIHEVLPLLEGGDHTEIRAGAEFWFTPPHADTPPPPRWKQAVLTYLVICPMTLLVPFLLSPLFERYPELAGVILGNLIINFFVIVPVVFVIMPWVTRLSANWLRT